MNTIIFADGASKNNPGEASAAAVIAHNGKIIRTHGLKLGVQTNNVAEYHGLLLALYTAIDFGIKNPVIRMDSNLVVQQFLGAWKCKEPTLKALLAKAQALKGHFESIDIAWVAREENTLADQAGNDILDGTIQESVPVGYGLNVIIKPMEIKPVIIDTLTSVKDSSLFDNFIQQDTKNASVQVMREELIALIDEARSEADSKKYAIVDYFMNQKIAGQKVG